GRTPTQYSRMQGLYIGYFSDVNTGRIRRFDPCGETWDTTDLANADFSTDVDFNRNIRVATTISETDLFYTSSADSADIEYVRYGSSVGSQTQILAATSSQASCLSDVVIDKTARDSVDRYISAWYYDVANDDFTVQSLSGTTL